MEASRAVIGKSFKYLTILTIKGQIVRDDKEILFLNGFLLPVRARDLQSKTAFVCFLRSLGTQKRRRKEKRVGS